MPCHGILVRFWRDFLVVVRPYDIQIFEKPTASHPPLLIKMIPFERFIYQAVVFDTAAHISSGDSESHNPPLSILINHYGGVSLYTIHLDNEVTSDTSSPNPILRLVGKYDISHNTRHHCWGLCVGSSGKCISWICAYSYQHHHLPCLLISNLNISASYPQAEDTLFGCEIDTMYELNHLPAL